MQSENEQRGKKSQACIFYFVFAVLQVKHDAGIAWMWLAIII